MTTRSMEDYDNDPADYEALGVAVADQVAAEKIHTAVLLRELLMAAGRWSIEYVVADQIAKHVTGAGLNDIMPCGGYGSFVAVYASDFALRDIFRRVSSMKDKVGSFLNRGLPAEARAESFGSGVWLVSGFKNGEVIAMNETEFAKFKKDVANAGKSLVTVERLKDGNVATMHYEGGKLHRDDGPAVEIKDGTVTVSEVWMKAGLKIEPPEHGYTRHI